MSTDVCCLCALMWVCLSCSFAGVSLKGVQGHIGGFVGAVDAATVADLNSVIPISKLLWQLPPLLWCDPHAQQMPLTFLFLQDRHTLTASMGLGLAMCWSYY